MYKDFWRLHVAAVIGFFCAAGASVSEVHSGNLWLALAWALAALGCLGILAAPATIKSRAEKSNPRHGRHSTGRTRY